MARSAPPGAAQTLTAGQIAGYAKLVGFSGQGLVDAVAIALAESSGGTAKIGGPNSDGSRDYGLWQINDRAHPDLITADAQWWSPAINAQMAFKVYSAAGNSFKPWSTYANGTGLRYLSNLPVAKTAAWMPDAVGEITPGEGGIITHDPVSDAISAMASPIAALANAMKAIAGAVFKATAWTANPKNWGRVAFIGVGGALVIGSMTLIAKPYFMGAAAPVVNAVTDVAPGGGVIKKAAKAAAKGSAK